MKRGALYREVSCSFFWGVGGGGELDDKQLLLFTLTLPSARSRFAFRCSFFGARQRTNQENVPRATPLDPARKPLRCSASLRKARLEGFVQRRFSVLFGTASKTGLAGDRCSTLGKLAARITKIGGVWLKPFSQTAGDTSLPVRTVEGAGSVVVYTSEAKHLAASPTPSWRQPSTTHLVDGVHKMASVSPAYTFSRRLCERSEQPKARTERGEAARVSKGLALWCVFLLRSLPQGKE